MPILTNREQQEVLESLDADGRRIRHIGDIVNDEPPPPPPPPEPEEPKGLDDYKSSACKFANQNLDRQPFVNTLGVLDSEWMHEIVYGIVWSRKFWNDGPTIGDGWETPGNTARRHVNDFLASEDLEGDGAWNGMPMHYTYVTFSEKLRHPAHRRPWQTGANNAMGKWVLTLNDLNNGFKLAEEKFPALFSKFLNPPTNHSQRCSTSHYDMMLQFAIFGKVIYL